MLFLDFDYKPCYCKFLCVFNDNNNYHYLSCYLLDLWCPLYSGKKAAPAAECSSLSALPAVARTWDQGVSADVWVTRVVQHMLRCSSGCGILDSVLPVCSLDPALCKLLLPHIIHTTLLTRGDDDTRTDLSNFFNTTIGEYNKSKQDALENGPAVRSIMIMLLHCVEFLWSQRPPRSFSKLPSVTAYDCNFWLALEHEQVAAAAQAVGRNHLALTLLEERQPVSALGCQLLVQVSS